MPEKAPGGERREMAMLRRRRASAPANLIDRSAARSAAPELDMAVPVWLTAWLHGGSAIHAVIDL
jgi:hypothetical protein